MRRHHTTSVLSLVRSTSAAALGPQAAGRAVAPRLCLVRPKSATMLSIHRPHRVRPPMTQAELESNRRDEARLAQLGYGDSSYWRDLPDVVA